MSFGISLLVAIRNIGICNHKCIFQDMVIKLFLNVIIIPLYIQSRYLQIYAVFFSLILSQKISKEEPQTHRTALSLIEP